MFGKMISKSFKSFRNILDFIKILILANMMLLLLYWIQNLTNASWGWIKPFEPFLKAWVSFGQAFSDGSTKLFAATFEYKYFIALFTLLVIYAVVNRIRMISEPIENMCDEGYQSIKKYNENTFNRALEQQANSEQSKINSYKILVNTTLKPKYSHAELGVNIDDENRIMNKFIIEKTGVNPEMFEGGFLYSFSDFEKIDKVLEVFFKIIKSNSKLDYSVCVQIVTENKQKDTQNLHKLKELNYKNKIYMMTETTYRYKFNRGHRYGKSKIGVFQKENAETFEVDEFIEI